MSLEHAIALIGVLLSLVGGLLLYIWNQREKESEKWRENVDAQLKEIADYQVRWRHNEYGPRIREIDNAIAKLEEQSSAIGKRMDRTESKLFNGHRP